MKNSGVFLSLCVLAFASLALAKGSNLVLLWPAPDKPTLKITFGRFDRIGAYAGQNSFVSPVVVENVSGKPIPRASFTAYLLDDKKIRIGNGILNVSDLGPGQQVKLAFQVFSVGVPNSISLTAHTDAAGIPTSLKTVPLKIISVPAGANVKIDGVDAGVTPRVASLTVGSHTLEFSKEGYATGTTPVEVSPDEMPGGGITFELGGLSRDTLELRNGSVVLGDVLSMSMTTVTIRVNGEDKTYDRNQVQKIILVERITTQNPGNQEGAPVPPK